MRCPHCDHAKSKCTETIPNGDAVYRRRVCYECGTLFKSVEKFYDGKMPAKQRRSEQQEDRPLKVTDISVFKVWN